MKNGRPGAMAAELILSTLFLGWVFDEYALKKIPFAFILLFTAAVMALAGEVLTLLAKLLLGGGKRNKAYFLVSLFSVCMMNMIGNQFEAAVPAMLMSFALVLSADVFGRCLCGFIRSRRFKQVFGYAALTAATVYLIFYSVFFFSDSWGESRIDYYNGLGDTVCADSSAVTEGFEDYLKNGPFTVSSLSYGPEADADIITETVDYTGFDSMDERGIGDKIIEIFSDYEFAETPVKGRIWYPEGKTRLPVFFFVHGNHDSDVPSYLGYEYLGEYLASNGYVVISVDENIINELGEGNDKRAILLLDNMKTILEENDNPDSPIYDLIDPERIAIGGHSRGGEMAATAYLFNDLDKYPDDGNFDFDYHFNIRSIVAIAPCVDQYRPVSRSVEISDVNYLLIHGSNDQDVSSMMGEKQYNNITFTGDGDENFIKSSVYILGANHGQFNSLWGRYDMAGVTNHFLNTYHFIDESDQKLIARAYIRSFLDLTLLGEDRYASLLRDVTPYEELLPDTVYVTCYEDSDHTPVVSFDDIVDLRDQGEGVIVNAEGTNTWTVMPYNRGNGGESENYVLFMSWPEETEPEFRVIFPMTDLSNGYISFGIADMREDTEDLGTFLEYTVELTDSAGNTASCRCPVPVYHSLAVQLYKQDALFGTYEYKHQLQTVCFRASDIEGAGELDLSEITEISISFDGSEKGSVIIDDLGYYPGM